MSNEETSKSRNGFFTEYILGITTFVIQKHQDYFDPLGHVLQKSVCFLTNN